MSQELINYRDKKTIDVLKNTVAKGATDEEFQMFAGLCEATGLNPFKKEVWFIKSGDKVQLMTGLNGFYQIANSHPQFDGLDLDYGPSLEVVAGTQKILAPEWVEAKVYRKDRSRPQSARAYWREYSKELVSKYGNLTIWAKMPSVMLAKCAESMALRKAFPQELNGLYTQEEMPKEYSIAAVTAHPDVVAMEKASEEIIEAHQNKYPVLSDEDLQAYVITSPETVITTLMLQEVPIEVFDLLREEKFKSMFSLKDLHYLREYFMRFVRKGYKTKAEQEERKEKLKKQAEEIMHDNNL